MIWNPIHSFYKIIFIIDTIFNIFLILFRGWLLGNHIYVKYSLFSVLLGYIWLDTFVNSSCDIKINVKIVKIAV